MMIKDVIFCEICGTSINILIGEKLGKCQKCNRISGAHYHPTPMRGQCWQPVERLCIECFENFFDWLSDNGYIRYPSERSKQVRSGYEIKKNLDEGLQKWLKL